MHTRPARPGGTAVGPDDDEAAFSYYTTEQVITTLRAQAAPDLQQAGIRHVAVFGPLVRGEAGPDSGIDLSSNWTLQPASG